MNPIVSVVIPTHNANQIRLQRTLDGLKSQILPNNNWELIIIDNSTPDPQYINSFDLSWHNSSKIIIEKQLGLTRARVAGIRASQGNYIVFVDDDNVLEPNYLENVVSIFNDYPDLGAIAGKSLPEFEVKPEIWVKDFWICLALRDLGEEVQIYFYSQSPNRQKQHPLFAPIGAGMSIQREAALLYAASLLADPRRMGLDRTGKSLQSGGDCDINLTLLDAGWGVGYFPQLQLTHLIPANRLTKDYLAQLNYASSRSWIQVLDFHGIRPWGKIPNWSIFPRKVKAFLSYQPWKSSEAFVRWQGSCGMFDGLANLPN